MPRAAVLGKPVGHSLSPVIHSAGYAAAGLTGWSYAAIECAESELAGLVGELGEGWVGLSLTMPLKQAAPAVAGRLAPLVATLGAANTLVRGPDGAWRAENTDVPGMVDALGAVPPEAEVVVLGAGGTARAALAAAARIGARQVRVVARRAAAVAALEPVAVTLGVPLSHVPWPAPDAATAADAVTAADLVVSTVPAGVADQLAARVRWRPDTVLLDVLYRPWPTRLAAAAGAAGCRVVPGLDLLLAQAVGQFELFTGVPAPVEAMRAALSAAAAGSGAAAR